MVEFTVLTDDSTPTDKIQDRTTTLPDTIHRTNEWDHFVVEVWVRGQGADPVNVQDLSLDLGYKTDLTSAVAVDFGHSFEGTSSFQINDQAGAVNQVHGTTAGVTLTPDDRVLFARVHFQAVKDAGDNVKLDPATGDVGPHSIQLVAQNITANDAGADLLVQQDPMPEMGLYPVIYDLNDDQKVGLADYNILLTQFGKTADTPGAGMQWYADFDKSDRVGLSDYNFLLTNFGQNSDIESVTLPANYPDAWIQPDSTTTGDGGGSGGTGSGGTGGGGTNDPPPPPPVFNLNDFAPNIILPGANDVFQLFIGAGVWDPNFQVNLLTGSASLSGATEDTPGDAILSIVLDDQELYETEIEIVLDGELIDTITEFNDYAALITSYVAEVVDSLKTMLIESSSSE